MFGRIPSRRNPRLFAATIAAAACAASGRAQEVRAPETLPFRLQTVLERYPDCDKLRVDGSRVWWRSHNGTEFAVVGLDAGEEPQVDTPLGPIAIDPWLFENDERIGFDAMVAAAIAAAPRGDAGPLRVGYQPALGLSLVGASVLVDARGVFVREHMIVADRSAEVSAIRAAAAVVRERLARAGLAPFASEALGIVLARACGDLDDGDEPAWTTDVDADLASYPWGIRRLIHDGWLARVLGPAIASDDLRAAVERASQPAAVARWRRAGALFERHEDAFGRTSYVHDRGDERIVGVPAAVPEFGSFPAAGWLEREEVRGADGSFRIGAVRFYEYGEPMASYRPATGLEWDAELWETLGVGDIDGVEHPLPDAVPPHIVVCDALGRVELLVTQHGVLPSFERGRDDPAAFVATAARVLPDGAHLDLLGNFLFTYAFDSPDPAAPELFGPERLSDDIHKSTADILATSTWGVCHGDCDDLAGLYVAILREQGHLAYAMGVPGHLQALWVTAVGDEHVARILQTGPALEFRGADLHQALAAAYRHQDPTATFNPYELLVAERFSGENMREDVALPARAFVDREFASLALEVAEDRHLGAPAATLARLEPLADADERGSSAVWFWVGHARAAACDAEGAVAAFARAGALATEPAARCWASIYEAAALARSGREDLARARIDEILTERLGALADESELAVMTSAVSLVEGLQSMSAHGLAHRAVDERIVPNARRLADAIGAQWFGRRKDPIAELDAGIVYETLLRHDAAIVESLRRRPEATAGRAGRTLRNLLQQLAFIEASGASDPVIDLGSVHARMAMAGQMHRLWFGAERFERELEQAEWPAADASRPGDPVLGVAQVRHDLPWIKLSPVFWVFEMSRIVDSADRRFDAAAFARAAAGFERATAESRARGLEDSILAATICIGSVLRAVIAGDDAALDAQLHRIRAIDDKALGDGAVDALAVCALAIRPERFGPALERWHDVVGRRCDYWRIAWVTATLGMADHARAAREQAVRRTEGDARFVDEAALFDRNVR